VYWFVLVAVLVLLSKFWLFLNAGLTVNVQVVSAGHVPCQRTQLVLEAQHQSNLAGWLSVLVWMLVVYMLVAYMKRVLA
jgi:hypothetical protein